MTDSVEKLRFQVEAQRVLEILSKQIYDSPYAMLRENVQNAYDAVLMRAVEDPGFTIGQAAIDVTVSPDAIVVSDNGVGMSEDILRNNFWRAGSSGKNTESARKAGVVGTFGIGAMANFGVCRSLRV